MKKTKFNLFNIQSKLDNLYLDYTSNFLDESEQALLLPSLIRSKRDFSFDGGYSEAQRKILHLPAVYNSNEVRPPISAIVFKKPCELTHRNVLGTLMSLGINRDVIGDIAIWDDTVQIIVLERMQEYILNNLNFINNHPIFPEIRSYDEIIPYSVPYELETTTVSSNRLDGVVASIFKTSRKKATSFIKEGFVLHNHLPIQKMTNQVEVGDTLSMKGKGKVKISDFRGKTKKGKLRINFKRYK